jgi:hypothetical protein
VIERSKSADVAQTILQKKDLGHKGAPQIVVIEEAKQVGSRSKLITRVTPRPPSCYMPCGRSTSVVLRQVLWKPRR